MFEIGFVLQITLERSGSGSRRGWMGEIAPISQEVILHFALEFLAVRRAYRDQR
jgi:hypothetical protein